MLSFQGYFEDGKFIPLNPVAIPEHKRAIVTILDEAAPQLAQKKALHDFLRAIESSDEEIPVEFERVKFSREVDL